MLEAGKEVEFGRKIRLDEVEGGIITGYAILERGGGQDQPYLKDGLEAHRRQFGRAPDLLTADRGLASAENERRAKEAGVKQVALPRVGRASPERADDRMLGPTVVRHDPGCRAHRARADGAGHVGRSARTALGHQPQL